MHYVGAELLNTCLTFGWDTNAEEVTLVISKEDGTVIYEVTRTTDYFQPLLDDWLKEIDRKEKLMAKVSLYKYVCPSFRHRAMLHI